MTKIKNLKKLTILLSSALIVSFAACNSASSSDTYMTDEGTESMIVESTVKNNDYTLEQMQSDTEKAKELIMPAVKAYKDKEEKMYNGVDVTLATVADVYAESKTECSSETFKRTIKGKTYNICFGVQNDGDEPSIFLLTADEIDPKKQIYKITDVYTVSSIARAMDFM